MSGIELGPDDKEVKGKVTSGLGEMALKTRALFNERTFIKPLLCARHPAGHLGEREIRKSPSLPSRNSQR